MKNTILVILTAFLFATCNTSTEEKTSDQASVKSDAPTIERSYTGRALNRFDQAILNMEQEDSTRIVQENEVLFIGSSSIRMWKTLRQDFDPIPGINRGFGGSTMPEVIHYADRIIFPYNPKLIVLYCGENDIAEDASPEQVFESFKKLDAMIEKRLPETNLIFISMKPSVARWGLWGKYKAGNKMIQEYLETKENRRYLESADVMLTENGEPDPTIFIEDMLHMNAKGYEGWKTLVRPAVEKFYTHSSSLTPHN